jgi:uncharacterized protein
MKMEMDGFTPVSATIGGVLIGLSAVMLLALNGRIAGISGIAGALVRAPRSDAGWRIMFLLGLLGGAGIYGLTVEVPVQIDASPWVVIAGGLLVGLGTQLGSGCTSGHGVCGIARLSPRSIVATLVFMAIAILTVFITRHLLGIYDGT